MPRWNSNTGGGQELLATTARGRCATRSVDSMRGQSFAGRGLQFEDQTALDRDTQIVAGVACIVASVVITAYSTAERWVLYPYKPAAGFVFLALTAEAVLSVLLVIIFLWNSALNADRDPKTPAIVLGLLCFSYFGEFLASYLIRNTSAAPSVTYNGEPRFGFLMIANLVLLGITARVIHHQLRVQREVRGFVREGSGAFAAGLSGGRPRIEGDTATPTSGCSRWMTFLRSNVPIPAITSDATADAGHVKLWLSNVIGMFIAMLFVFTWFTAFGRMSLYQDRLPGANDDDENVACDSRGVAPVYAILFPMIEAVIVTIFLALHVYYMYREMRAPPAMKSCTVLAVLTVVLVGDCILNHEYCPGTAQDSSDLVLNIALVANILLLVRLPLLASEYQAEGHVSSKWEHMAKQLDVLERQITRLENSTN